LLEFEPLVFLGAGFFAGVDLASVFGSLSSFSQSSSSLEVFATPGARNARSQCGHLTRFPAALSATETAPLQWGH
jgi:hypothetical protein